MIIQDYSEHIDDFEKHLKLLANFGASVVGQPVRRSFLVGLKSVILLNMLQFFELN